MSRVLLDYPHRTAGHCGSGALRDLLDWAELGCDGPPDEGLLFELGGALGFAYLRVPGLVPPVYLVGRGGDLELDLLHRLGASTDLRRTEDPVLGWRWVRDELDAGRPVMVWADIAELQRPRELGSPDVRRTSPEAQAYGSHHPERARLDGDVRARECCLSSGVARPATSGGAGTGRGC